jgi:exopolysaccharide biosynthesis polyprenyl glycosylphosphotransferase
MTHQIWLWSVAIILAVLAIARFRRQSRDDDIGLTSKVVLPMLNKDGSAAGVAPANLVGERKKKFERKPPVVAAQPPNLIKQYDRENMEAMMSLVAICGDLVMIISGFVLAYLLSQSQWVSQGSKSAPNQELFQPYYVILAGSILVLWGLTGKELYAYRNLLSPAKCWDRLLESVLSYLFAFIGISQIAQYGFHISCVYFGCAAAFIIVVNLFGWRFALSQIIRHPTLASRLRRRLVVIGGGSQTLRIQKALDASSDLEFVGWVQANKPNHVKELEDFKLGAVHELGAIVREHAINLAILTESDSIQREGVLALAMECEKEHVQFKMVPHFFEILITGLRSENVAGVQLLGVDALPLSGFRNQMIKRFVDIVGSIVGLMIALPLIVIFGTLIYLESPGPILYKQLRQGRSGRLFYIIKLRSMHMNAEEGGKVRWAQKDDTRRLQIGAFMRKWNIDEVPQFWNVLRGQMSLVGPRPERPELIARFKSKIAHYQSRHMCQPGITGWAQINGWRGNTDLDERIRHDIWYLENWSIWLDFRIMIQTLIRNKNAY